MRTLPYAKPARKEKKRRQHNSSLPISEKRPKSRKPVKAVNRKRKASAFERCYHSKARVEFVKTLRCAASDYFGTELWPVENAHVCDDGTKGASRKSGYRCIAPLLVSVHKLLHDHPRRFRELYPHFDAEKAAAETEAAWQSHAYPGKAT